MNDITQPERPGQSAPVAASESHNLEKAYQSLRTQFVAMLITMVVLSGSFNIFIFKQVSLVRRQAAELEQIIADYRQKSAPEMNSFLNKLREFGKTNADFGPILAKYLRPATNTQSALPNLPASNK